MNQIQFGPPSYESDSHEEPLSEEIAMDESDSHEEPPSNQQWNLVLNVRGRFTWLFLCKSDPRHICLSSLIIFPIKTVFTSGLGPVWYVCLKTENCCLKIFVEIRVGEKVPWNTVNTIINCWCHEWCKRSQWLLNGQYSIILMTYNKFTITLLMRNFFFF